MLLRVLGIPTLWQTDRRPGQCLVQHQQGGHPRQPQPAPGHDVDIVFGRWPDQPLVDWSGNCSTCRPPSAPAPSTWALIAAARISENGVCTLRIWQANIGKPSSCAHHPWPGAETATSSWTAWPSPPPRWRWSSWPRRRGWGHVPDRSGAGHAGCARRGQLSGHADQRRHPHRLPQRTRPGLHRHRGCSATSTKTRKRWRAWSHPCLGGVADGPDRRPGRGRAAASTRQKLPSLPRRPGYATSSGRRVEAGAVDLLVRALSMGQLHHA